MLHVPLDLIILFCNVVCLNRVKIKLVGNKRIEQLELSYGNDLLSRVLEKLSQR